jgi:hypothetical protein
MPWYKTPELIVESQPRSSSEYYNPYPISILESSNSILAEKITHSRAREHPPTCVPVQIMNEDEEEKE